jgi:multiple sugar transport system permease protein
MPSRQGLDTVMAKRSSVVKSRLSRSLDIFAYGTVVPILAFYALFLLFPLCFAFYLSLVRWMPGLKQIPFVALANYRKMFTTDELFLVAMKNTLYFTAIRVPLCLVLAVCIAVGIDRVSRGSMNVFLPAYFAPQVTCMAAVAVVFAYLYDPQVGLLNEILRFFRLPALQYIYDKKQAIPSLVLVDTWRSVGWGVVIFVAALQAVPSELYDAAKVDGATSWQIVWRVTLPLIFPTIVFYIIMSVIWCLQIFDIIYVMAPNGGILNSALTIVHHIYREGFLYTNLSYAASMSNVLFVLIMVITYFIYRYGKPGWEL